MRTLSPAVLAALASGNAVIVQMVHMAFSSGAIALNSSTWDLVFGGVTYRGAAGLGSVSAITDKPGEVQGIRLDIAGGSPASISLALDDADIVQGTPLTLSTAILDAASYQVLDVVTDWVGRLDTMAISEDGKQAAISVTAESRAVDLLRGNASSYSDGDQRARFPGDLAFAFVVSAVDKKIVWPAREYFLKS